MNKNKTLNSIINTCKDIIFEDGLKHSSAGNIASRGGFSKSIIFYYFDNIDKLHDMVLENCIENISPILNNNYSTYSSISRYLYKNIETLISEKSKARDLKVLFTFAHDRYFFTNGPNKIKDILIEKISLDIMNSINYYYPDTGIEESEAIGSLIMTSFNGLGVFLLQGDNNEKFLRNWSIQSQMVEAYLNNFHIKKPEL